MSHPLADNMYDHDQIQGQDHARQVQEEINQTHTPSTKAVDDYNAQMDVLIKILGSESGNDVYKLMTDGQKIKLQQLIDSAVKEGRISEIEHLLDAHQFFAPTHKQLTDRLNELNALNSNNQESQDV